jgi:GGDEF domain-containing protein
MAEDIKQPAPVRPVMWRQDQRRDQQGEARSRADFAHAASVYELLSSEDRTDPEDPVSVQGIPARDLTPAVRRALNRLMGEVNRLRQMVAEQGGPGLVEPHPFDGGGHGGGPFNEGPALLDAVTFEDALRDRLRAMDRGASSLALAFLYMANYEEIRSRHGLAAAEAARSAMTDTVLAAREEGEIMGTAGGASILALIPHDGQVDRLWARARALGHAADITIPWHGGTVPVHALIGVHVIRFGESPGDVIWQAERAARRIV